MASLEDRTLGLETAVNQILQSSQTKKPFFFLIGSGVSFPSVVGTGDIINMCKDIAKKQSKSDDEPDVSMLDSYTYWFLQAFPNAKDRQNFIKNLVCDKPVSGSAFRLAHILSSQAISNTVITTNFDELIEKALGLFGVSYISHQHPSVADQIDFEHDGIQIIHVHGTFRYYDLCNLKDEILDRAKRPDVTSVSVANRLDQLLMTKSPIIIGYGGWDGDVITGAIKRRLYGLYGQSMQLPYNIYWFCFDQPSFDLIPDYIREHQNVMFVMPDSVAREHKDFNRSSILTASDVFDMIIRTSGIGKPDITKDPLCFFADLLEKTFSPPEVSRGTDIDDPYDILSIAHRIRHSELKNLSQDETTLETIRDWMRVSNYGMAARILKDLDYEKFDLALLPELLSKTRMIISKIINRSPYDVNELTDTSSVFDKMEKIRQRIIDKRLLTPEEWCEMLYSKSFASYVMQKYDQSLAYSEQIVADYENINVPVIRLFVLKAQMIKAGSLVLNDRMPESLPIIENVYGIYRNSRYPEEKMTIASGLSLMAQMVQSKDKEIAYDIYKKSLSVISDDANKEMRFVKMRVLVNMAICLEMMGRGEKTLDYLDEAIRIAEGDKSGMYDIALVGALFNKGYKLFQIKKYDESIAIYKQLIFQFRHNSDGYYQGSVCDSHNTIGLMLLKQGKIDQSRIEFKKALEVPDNRRVEIKGYHVISHAGCGEIDKAIKLLDEIQNMTTWKLMLLDENLSNFEPEIDVSKIRDAIAKKLSK
jgi:tetratricopeptide (TPR) repeat protein